MRWKVHIFCCINARKTSWSLVCLTSDSCVGMQFLVYAVQPRVFLQICPISPHEKVISPLSPPTYRSFNILSYCDIWNVDGRMLQWILNKYCCTVLLGWSLLPNALGPFQIYCAPTNLGITRTWIYRLNFAQRPIFSGLRFFNEPKVSESGTPA